MSEFTDKSDLNNTEVQVLDQEKLQSIEEPPIPDFVIPTGTWGKFRHRLRQAGKPRYRNPVLAAALQIIPGLGYIYMWRWASALLTAFLFIVAYMVIGLRFLQFNDAEFANRASPNNPNPEPDMWNWSVLTPGSLLLVAGIMALLILSIAARTYRQVQLDNLNLQVKSMSELRKARGSIWSAIIFFNYLATVVLILGIIQVLKDTEFDIGKLFDKFNNLLNYIGGLLNPAWGALWQEKGILFRARETLEVSIVGTLLGAIFALPLSLLAARNLMGRHPITNICYYIVRIILSIQRSVPTLFLAIIFVVSVGVGPFPAVLALMLFSTGLMTKLFSEAIEAIDWGQVEAVQAAGGSIFHVVFFGVVPQVIPYIISHMLYCWEVNIHSAAVLGLVGAGGIGAYVQDAIESYKYAEMGMALLVVVVITMSIDFTSAYVRSRVL